MKIARTDLQNRYSIHFDTKTGFYIRTDVLTDEGENSGNDPFMGSFPELLDVGIMGRCLHGLSGLCSKAGIQCYQSGKKIKKPNMSFHDFKWIVDQSKDRVLQIALGGRGDPNKHERFRDICKYCRENNIVPNYTTSGLDLTDAEVEATRDFCGAVAVSNYHQQYTYDAIQRFLDVGATTNIHYVLSNTSIDDAIDLVKNDKFPTGINAVIFLLYKPVGMGVQCNVLKYDNPKVKEFFGLISHYNGSVDIGFDSCSIPAILNLSPNVSRDSIDTCEGARFSAYISSDMKMLPCSFDQELKWAVDLRTHTIQEAWNGKHFDDFRLSLKNSCVNCKDRKHCMGGCPIQRDIVLCQRGERS